MDIIRFAPDGEHPRLTHILNRAVGGGAETDRAVAAIITAVREQGDDAVIAFTEQFDGITLTPDNLRVEPALLEDLAAKTSPELRAHVRRAIENVRIFHERQREASWTLDQEDGVALTHRVSPLDRVGLYIPGGKAAYPSSVIMNAIPAKVAGVPRIVAVTPPGSFMANPLIATALVECGVTEVYTVGGAQAVAALAYGTQTIPRVDKIVGPGNSFVAAAKRRVYGQVDIDGVAGPSEVVVLADDTANPDWVAADLLAQAEHDAEAAAVCVTTSERIAFAVRDALENQAATLSRRETVLASLRTYGAIFLVPDLAAACALVDRLAPEHLGIVTADAEAVAARIRYAGAIFLGEFSPEPVGDYFAGPSHVLPTNGTARFFSPLGVYDFVRRTNLIRYTSNRLRRTAEAIVALAEAEGFDAHARSIKVRVTEVSPAAPTTEPLPGLANPKLLL